MESVLCWPAALEHGACPEVWLIHVETLHRRKLGQQVSVTGSFVTRLEPCPFPHLGAGTLSGSDLGRFCVCSHSLCEFTCTSVLPCLGNSDRVNHRCRTCACLFSWVLLLKSDFRKLKFLQTSIWLLFPWEAGLDHLQDHPGVVEGLPISPQLHIFNSYTLIYLPCVCECREVGVHMPCTCVWVRGQLGRASSLLSLCGCPRQTL